MYNVYPRRVRLHDGVQLFDYTIFIVFDQIILLGMEGILMKFSN